MPGILGSVGEWFPVAFCMDWNLELPAEVPATLSYLGREETDPCFLRGHCEK